MFKPVRIVATIVFIAMIGMIFITAFVIKSDVRPSPTPYFKPYVLILSRRFSALVGFPSALCVFLYLRSFTVFVILEYLAYTWYTLSYIPYARSAILKMIGMG